MSKPPPAAGYSGTPLPKKLGLAAGQVALLVDAPEGHPEAWGELPAGFSFLEPGRLRGNKKLPPLDMVVAFATSLQVLARDLGGYLAGLAPAGVVWVVWPKKTPAKGYAKIDSDISEDGIREVALPLGLVDVKVCAVDGSWSGLKLVVRKELRPAAGAQKPSTRTRSPRSTKRTA
jgi:hypothetical protein